MTELAAPKNLTRNVLIGMGAGFVIGAFIFYTSIAPKFIEEFFSTYIFSLGGDIFKNLLKLIVVPLVFFSLVSGISSLNDMARLGSIAYKTVGLYLLTTAFAVSLALFFGWLTNLGAGFSGDVAPTELAGGEASFYDTVMRIFPSNMFGAFVENNMLGIVFISILFGIALNATDSITGGLSKSFEKLNTVFLKIVLMVMQFAPYGVFCLIGAYVASKGLDIFGDVAQYVILLIFVLVFHLLFTYSLILAVFARLNPIKFFNKMKDVMLFAFSTSSSAATIPVTLKTVTQDLGVKKDVGSFVVPVGATINMDGTAIMQGLATVFIAGITPGIELGVVEYVQIIFLAVITSIGTAAVPSAGIVTLTIILSQLGIPLEAIGLILAVDRILDMLRTSINVCGDAAVSCIVAKTEGGLDEKVFNS